MSNFKIDEIGPCSFCGKNPVCDDKFGLCGYVEEDHLADFDICKSDDHGFSCCLVCKNCNACGPESDVFANPDNAANNAIYKWNGRRVLN